VLNYQPEFNHRFYVLDASYTKGHKSVLQFLCSTADIFYCPQVCSVYSSRFMALVGISARFMFVLQSRVRSRPLPCRILHRTAIIRLAQQITLVVLDLMYVLKVRYVSWRKPFFSASDSCNLCQGVSDCRTMWLAQRMRAMRILVIKFEI
jgi:hypothetical protein